MPTYPLTFHQTLERVWRRRMASALQFRRELYPEPSTVSKALPKAYYFDNQIGFAGNNTSAMGG